MRTLYLLIALLTYSPLYAEEKRLCAYPDNNTREFEEVENCGDILADGALSLATKIINNARWSKYGLQCIYINYPGNRGWYYINQNGLGRGTPFTQDNDCSWFKSGLAVGVSNGKVIYFDQALAIVKSTEYTWAGGFYNGFSKVCTGKLIKESMI